MKVKILGIVGVVVFLSGCALTTNQAPANVNTQTTNNSPVSVSGSNKLDLSHQELEKIPENVFSKTNLVELDVSDNKIQGAIQGEIRHLKNLKVLDASNNLMTGVPAEVGQLQNLEVLDLSNNQLTGLPLELGNLKNLKELIISGNDYSEYDLNLIKASLPSDVVITK